MVKKKQKRRKRYERFVEVRTTACHAGSDGDCYWKKCPQLRDGEPERSDRNCPLLNKFEVHT